MTDVGGLFYSKKNANLLCSRNAIFFYFKGGKRKKNSWDLTMAIRGNPPLDDWLNNFDRVLEEKYQWAPPATVSNSQLPSRMANPTVLSSADFIA